MPKRLYSSEALWVKSKQMMQAIKFKHWPWHQPSISNLYQEEAKDFCGGKKLLISPPEVPQIIHYVLAIHMQKLVIN